MGIVDGREKKVGVYVQPVLYGEQVCKHGVCMNELNEVFFSLAETRPTLPLLLSSDSWKKRNKLLVIS